MKGVPLLILAGLTVLAACPKPQSVAAVTPQPNGDSLAAARQAHDDSVRAAAEARARAEQERLAEQHRLDSLAAAARMRDVMKQTVVGIIHFDCDKFYVRPPDAEVLDRKIPVLKTNAELRIQIAGNCDERGSDEYNLALGNRRALSARQYLISHGIEEGRIQTISYGKERPLDPGHNEEAWAKNRNDQFEILTNHVVLRQP